MNTDEERALKLEVQEMREHVQRLQLKEKKFSFMLNNMHRMCVHHKERVDINNRRVTLYVRFIHFLEQIDPGEIVQVDAESFEAQIDRLMKEAQ